jgi:hypothetical protein
MKGSEIFSSKSLKAEDIKGHEPVVTIEKVTTQDFDDGKKPIIHFVGKEKTLVCNKTNWNAIVEITGEDDSDNWGGHRVKLVVARVDYQGKRVDAIRIDPPPVNGAPARRAPSEPVEQPDEDQIPF